VEGKVDEKLRKGEGNAKVKKIYSKNGWRQARKTGQKSKITRA